MTEDDIAKKIAKRLLSARKSKHLTQEEVAKKAGVSVNYYAQVERGEINPSTSNFLAIIKALGVSSADILGK